MEILYLLLPVTFIFVVILVGCVIWATLNNQFENFEDAGSRILQREANSGSGDVVRDKQSQSEYANEIVKPE